LSKDDLPQLSSLIGEQLSAVIFVVDYLQFDFNGSRLTVFSRPVVEIRGHRERFPEHGSRDALCSLIQQEVTGASTRDGDSIEIIFRSGAHLLISVKPGTYDGPEAATFSHPNAPGLLVW
jgi:hypothetical protein